MDHRIHQLQSHPLSMTLKKNTAGITQPTISFKETLAQATALKISKHAQKRLDERNISIDQKRWAQINAKVAEAKSKGISDSLVVMDEAALIVNAKNNTVITAMNRSEASSQIFTNINGTILID
ncbi:flagellar protein [Bacillus luteolus]|uniref:Flagellar protein n=1 Tax=Litchfieldia luteola TaxID=682179 RepID=A0ABR9QJV2_9BACI|nr:TIGR02530 family flagellar biosynthesis protein [Cytobacillus luteolus]MBE4908724.1 flagellar protein [Cytobacillus luteolus]MBP1941583.1 flagellar operon protein [Cytobacillus luteolus]